jgi:hypothetical protein
MKDSPLDKPFFQNVKLQQGYQGQGGNKSCLSSDTSKFKSNHFMNGISAKMENYGSCSGKRDDGLVLNSGKRQCGANMMKMQSLLHGGGGAKENLGSAEGLAGVEGFAGGLERNGSPLMKGFGQLESAKGQKMSKSQTSSQKPMKQPGLG